VGHVPVQSTPAARLASTWGAMTVAAQQRDREALQRRSRANVNANSNDNVTLLSSTSNPNPNPNPNRNPASFSVFSALPISPDLDNNSPFIRAAGYTFQRVDPQNDWETQSEAEDSLVAMWDPIGPFDLAQSLTRPALQNGMVTSPPEVFDLFEGLREELEGPWRHPVRVQDFYSALHTPAHSHSHSQLHPCPSSQPSSHPEQSRGERLRRTQTSLDSTRSRSRGCPPTNLQAVRAQPAPVVVKSVSPSTLISPAASPAGTSATISPPARPASMVTVTAAPNPPAAAVQTAQRVGIQRPQPASPSHDDTSLTYRGMGVYNRLNPSSYGALDTYQWLTLDPANDDMLLSMPAPRPNRRSPPHLHQPLGTPATSTEEDLLHQVHTLEVELLQTRLNANSRRLSVAEQRFRQRDQNPSASAGAGAGAGGNAPSNRLRESEQRLRDAEARLADTQRRLRRTRSARDDVLGVEGILSQLEDPGSVDSTVRIRQLREDRTASRNRLETRLRELAEVRRAARGVAATSAASSADTATATNIEPGHAPREPRRSRHSSNARDDRINGIFASDPALLLESSPGTEPGRPGHQLVDWAQLAEGNESVVQAASRRLYHYVPSPRDGRDNPGATRGIETFVDMLGSVETDNTARDVDRDETMERLAQAIVDSADGMGNDEEEEEQRRERQRRRSVQRSLRGGAVLEARGQGRSAPPQAPLPRRATWAEVNEPSSDVELGPVPAVPRRQRPYISILDL
jgi:hypothetical protein